MPQILVEHGTPVRFGAVAPAAGFVFPGIAFVAWRFSERLARRIVGP